MHIEVVCTANICRSPMAAALLRNEIERRSLGWTVTSSGFMFEGEAASADAQAVMAERGVDLTEHRSRIVSADIVDVADVVVCMERRHARQLVTDMAADAAAVHTLGALVDALADGELVTGQPVERALAVGASRPAADLLGSGPDEVADPHGRSRREHRATADRLGALVTGLVTGLLPPD